MKKLLATTAITLLAIAASGCSDDPTEETNVVIEEPLEATAEHPMAEHDDLGPHDMDEAEEYENGDGEDHTEGMMDE